MTTSKYQIEVIKFISIDHEQISEELRAWLLCSAEMTYKDQILEEHIYNIDGTLDSIESGEWSIHESLLDELHGLHKELQLQETEYLRITF